MKNNNYLLLFLCILIISSCKDHPNRTVQRGFYFWKTSFVLDEKEKQAITGLKVKDLYLRFLDVDWNDGRKMAQPVSPMVFKDTIAKSVNAIPVVFITNRTIINSDTVSLKELASNVLYFVRRQCELQKISPKEIQIDCDWSGKSKAKYFYFLKALKKSEFLKNKVLSATIRMHQIKYEQQTGIPPVDKGLLMCYNMGDLRKYGDHNSIIDQRSVESYLGRLSKYPLKLDVAFPLFSWSVLFRNELYAGLLGKVTTTDLQNKNYFEKQGKSLYKVLNDVNLKGYSFKKGEVIRDESYVAKDILKAAEFCSSRIQNDNIHVILFHLDSSILNNYQTNEIEKIYSSF